jgi:cell division protein FtsQ
MVRRFFRGLAQGQAEMKKMGSKRGSGFDSGLGSAVLTAPEESYASETEVRGTRRGPAPAGALQRGYGKDGYGSEGYDEPGGNAYERDEAEYVPRRGNLRLRFRGLPRSVGGRIVFGVVAFVLLGSVAVAAAGVRYYLMHDARFVLGTADEIQITGAEHLTRGQVLTVFGADLERNIFRVSLAERQADLERLPWVSHAAVMRLLPHTIRVEITERTPVAFVRQGTQIGLVDGNGVLLDMPPDAAGDPHYSFPVLTGLTENEPLSQRAARMEIYQQFMRELDSTGQHLTDSVSEVDVADPEDVKGLVTSGSSDVMVHFGQEQFLKRYQEFEQHLPEWKQQYPKLASADMRYEGQIVLEMQGDGGAVSGGSGTATVAAVNEVSAAPVVEAGIREQGLGIRAKSPVSAEAVASKVPAPKPVVLTPAVLHGGQVSNHSTAAVKDRSRFPSGMTERKATAKATTTAKATAQVVATPKLTVAKVKKPVAKKVVAKRVVGRPKPGSGVDAANQKVFARLAAEHRAELAKEHKAEMAKNGRAGGKSGVTP